MQEGKKGQFLIQKNIITMIKSIKDIRKLKIIYQFIIGLSESKEEQC